MTKAITVAVMLIGVLSWIAWDIVVASNRVAGDTISEITLALARRCPLVPLAVGIILGHLFGTAPGVRPVASAVSANPWIPLLVGILAGAICWPQLKP